MLRARIRPLLAALASAAGVARLGAQAAPAPALPPLNFSGIIFGSYNFQRSTTPNPLNRQTDNAFIVDRAYLTFRMPAGDHTSIRITTDLYQSSETTPNAYTIRAKYAYLQYDGNKMDNGLQMAGRVGILQNVVIEHEETFWPRYLAQTAIERAGFFSSADVGLATQIALPNKMGELYATIVNGPSYTSRETDRFKDYAVRLSITPLANNKDLPLLQTFTITAWGYKGATASTFVNGGAATNGSVGSALDRSRAGLFAGIKDPRFVLAAEVAQRHEDGELGANTIASPRALTETSGRVLSAFTVLRPFAFVNASGKSPFGIVARYDGVKPTANTNGFATVPPADNAYHTAIGGLFWDLSQKAQIALDYQESLASSNGVSNAPPAPSKAYFAHFVVNF